MKRKFSLHTTRATLLALLCASSLVSGAIVQTQVAFDSGSFTLKNTDGSTLLSAGTASDGDGAVIQLGYYDGATTGTATSNFSGTWHALTGAGSLNTGGNLGGVVPKAFNTTSIGDVGLLSPAGAGIFGITAIFDSNVAGTFNDLPSATTIPLAIKFFNGTSIASSTAYNVVSNDAWVWKFPAAPEPTPPTINMSLDDAGLKWESVNVAGQAGSTAFTTSIAPVPEPSVLTFSALAALALAGARQRRK